MGKINLKTVEESPGLKKVFSNRMKLTRKIIRQQIIDKSVTVNKDGYVAEVKDNLISTVLLEDFIDDLTNGNGNELKSKFKALYSSSALCVNYFGFFTRHLNKFVLLGESNFGVGKFEVKLPTGLKGTAPNLDFVLKNDSSIIGIESKFLELLTPKKPIFSLSYSDSFLNTVDKGLSKIVNHYRTNNGKTYCDTAQLIKHSIGLLKEKKKGDKSAKLIYLYWEPINANEYYEYSQHKMELADFADRMKAISGLSFHYFTYFEFYTLFTNDSLFKQHLTNFKNRYLL
jgi:hypothetical protein